MFSNPCEQSWNDPSPFQHDWARSRKAQMRGFGAEELDWPPFERTPMGWIKSGTKSQAILLKISHLGLQMASRTHLNLVEILPRRVEVGHRYTKPYRWKIVRRKADTPIFWQYSVFKHNQCSTAWTILRLIPTPAFHCWDETLSRTLAAFLLRKLFISQCHFLNVAFNQVLNNRIRG